MQDNDKPQWDDDIDIGDIMPPEPEDASPKKQKKKKKRKRDADDGGDDAAAIDLDAMDADVTREYEPEEEWDGTEEMRKRKLQEYMDTLDEMEFNDIVRFCPTYFPDPAHSFAGGRHAYALQVHHRRHGRLRARARRDSHGDRRGPQPVRRCQAIRALPQERRGKVGPEAWRTSAGAARQAQGARRAVARRCRCRREEKTEGQEGAYAREGGDGCDTGRGSTHCEKEEEESARGGGWLAVHPRGWSRITFRGLYADITP